MNTWPVWLILRYGLVWCGDWSVPSRDSLFFPPLPLFVLNLPFHSASFSLCSLWNFLLSSFRLLSTPEESSEHSPGFHPHLPPLAALALVLTSQLTLLLEFSRNHPFGRQCTLCIFFQGRNGCFCVILNVPLDYKYHGFLLIYLGISKFAKSTNLH